MEYSDILKNKQNVVLTEDENCLIFELVWVHGHALVAFSELDAHNIRNVRLPHASGYDQRSENDQFIQNTYIQIY